MYIEFWLALFDTLIALEMGLRMVHAGVCNAFDCCYKYPAFDCCYKYPSHSSFIIIQTVSKQTFHWVYWINHYISCVLTLFYPHLLNNYYRLNIICIGTIFVHRFYNHAFFIKILLYINPLCNQFFGMKSCFTIQNPERDWERERERERERDVKSL